MTTVFAATAAVSDWQHFQI